MSPDSEFSAAPPELASVEALFEEYARTRDPEPLAKVYDRVAARLLAIALHVSASPSLAEDAVQDTFLFVLENPERWDTNRPLLPWLTGILANKLKRTAHRATRTPDPARIDLPNHTGHHTGPLRTIESDEVLTEIEHAIEHLPQPYRSVVLLRLRNHLDPADIAVALGRSPSTVRTQLSRGIEMLRRLLPAGVASLFVGVMTSPRGLAMVRSTVLDRATTVQSLFAAERTARRLGALQTLLGTAAAAGLLIAAVLLLPETGSPGEPRSDDREPALRSATAASTRTGDSETELVATIAAEDSATDRGTGRSPANAPATATGTLRLQVHAATGGIPFAPIHLEPLDETAGFLVHRHSGLRGQWTRVVPGRTAPRDQHRHVITDRSGACTVAGLAAGSWLVHTLGRSGAVRVAAGEQTDGRIEISDPVHVVRGEVRDPTGVALANTRIWICREHLDPLRETVVRTDATGRFEIAVAEYTTLGTGHPEHGPVGRSIGPDDPPELAVTFTMQRPGATLRGLVRDADGEPLAGATVQIGHVTDAQIPVFASSVQELCRPLRVTTDAQGRFEATGLAPGDTFLGARARGHGGSSVSASLRSGAATDVEIRLPTEAVAAGTVTDRAGSPRAGLVIRCGHSGAFDYRSTVSDADGHYELRGLAPGITRLQAVDFRGGFATTIVDLGNGARSTWNPRIDGDDLRLTGRVLASDGRPFAGGYIARITAWKMDVSQLDADGAFSLDVSEREGHAPTTIRVYAKDPLDPIRKLVGVPLLIERGSVAGSRDLELRIPPPDAASAWVRGKLRNADGTPLPPTQPIYLTRDSLGSSWRVRVDPLGPDGEFESGAIPPGDYTVRVASRQGLRLGPFRVEPATTTDLGDLRVRVPDGHRPEEGRVACRLAIEHPLARTDAGEVFVRVLDARDEVVFERILLWPSNGYSATNAWLLPGRYRIEADTAQGARGARAFDVQDDAPQLRAIVLKLGSPGTARTGTARTGTSTDLSGVDGR